MPQPPDAEQQLATLKLTYDRVCHERDRLRDARGFFARSLGPLPASAGISTALVAVLGEGENPALLVLALVGLVALVVLGIWYDGAPAYRHLYAARAGSDPGEDLLAPADWYRAMIRREREIYGADRTRNRWRAPWEKVRDLQDGLDHERTGVRLVQAVWVLVVAALVLSVLV